MATINLVNPVVDFSDGYDSIIIPTYIDGKVGGVALNMTGYTLPSVRAGHVIIKETATGEFKPMPVTGTGATAAYGTLPAGHTYYGHAVQSVPSTRPAVGIVTRGKLNNLVIAPASGVYSLATILTALKAALPLMEYVGDNA